MKKILNTEYAGIHAFYWMLYGASYSFASAFLLARGYSNSEIGIILAAGNVAAVFLQPFLADLADRSKRISLIGAIQFSTLLIVILTGVNFILQNKSLALCVVYVLLLAWVVALQPLINSLAFKLEESGFHINFGVARSMGSLGYSLLCSFLGTLVERKGVDVLPISSEIILLMLFVSLWLTKTHFARSKKTDRRSAGEILDSAGSAEPGHEPEEINLVQFISRNKLFLALNVGVSLVFFSNGITNNFMLQIVNGVGGDSGDLGRILSLMAFMEIPALVLFDNIHKKFSCQTLLKFSSFAFAIKIFVIFISNSVGMLYFAHIFQTFSFGIFLPAIVAYINEIMDKGEAVKGQALYTVMITVSSVFASVIGGIVLDVSGPKILLLASTIITLTGTAIIWLLIGKIKGKNK